MGFRVLGLSLLIFVYLINLTSSYPIRKTLSSEFVQKIKLGDKEKYGSKIEGGAHHGGTHGQSHGNGNSGGGAVIPIYAAGAANKNRQHQNRRSAASCNLNKINFSTMLMITFVYPLMLFFC